MLDVWQTRKPCWEKRMSHAPSLRGILHNLHSAHGLLAIPASERWSGAEENSSKIRIFLKFLQHIAHICCGCKLHVAYFLVHSAAILSCPSLFRFFRKGRHFSSHHEMLRGVSVSASNCECERISRVACGHQQAHLRTTPSSTSKNKLV